jgi:hypothetical protein
MILLDLPRSGRERSANRATEDPRTRNTPGIAARTARVPTASQRSQFNFFGVVSSSRVTQIMATANSASRPYGLTSVEYRIRIGARATRAVAKKAPLVSSRRAEIFHTRASVQMPAARGRARSANSLCPKSCTATRSNTRNGGEAVWISAFFWKPLDRTRSDIHASSSHRGRLARNR